MNEAGLSNKVAVITGGAIGFGRAFGRALASRGARVAILDIDLPGATEAANELRSEKAEAIGLGCDVARSEQVEQAVTQVTDELGGVDILVNNAARHLSYYAQPFSKLPPEDVRNLFDVNVFGVINCTLACRPSMAERGGGAIINISSISGHQSATPYGVTKLAVRGLTIAFATELAEDGIRVNAISPGPMTTENAVRDLTPEHFKKVTDRQLIRRRGTMEDIVNTLLFLCSDQASFITGQTLAVNGGFPLAI